MTYSWNYEKIRFMLDAEAYEKRRGNDFYADTAKLILKTVPESAYVCDAGCGMGFLSLELARGCKLVDSVDISNEALSFLRQRASAGIRPICCDMNDYVPDRRLDAAVFSLFGSIENMLFWSRQILSSNGMLHMIVKNTDFHRFSIGSIPIRRFTRDEVADHLIKNGIPFEETPLTAELGQPLRSEDEAVLFFKTYSRDDDKEAITFEAIRDRLIFTDDREFPLYLPPKKRLVLISVSASDFM
ncbi:MAG: methyltransferase domain-containing protein [Clostridia bacterium]|nr:methyltransferase domain-containing protein [Clostridia bacterium]